MIQMFINNEEVVSDKEFSIVEEMLTTSSTILNNCYPKTWENTKDYTSNFYYPMDYSKCTIYKNNILLFAGVVKNSGEISLNPFDPKYCSLQILDFKTFLSEGETLDFVIANKTIIEAINQVVDAVKEYGFVVGNINIANGEDIIGAYSTLNKTAYDTLQYLANISQSRWSTRLVDEDTIAIDFYDPTLMPRAENLQYNQNYFENNEIIDVSFSYGTYDYRNKQVINSEEVYADISYNENIIANGYDRVFTLTSNIAIINTITVNGLNKTVIPPEYKELGLEADFYYNVGEKTIESDENNPVISAGSQIIVNYTPLVKGRQIVYDNDEVNRINMQTGRKGIIARYEDRNDVLSSQELNKIAQTYIRYKGSAEIILKVQTKNNDLYDIGQIVYFEAPINDLQQDYMVKKKTLTYIATIDTIFYEYELSSSFNSERAINWFDNQRNKANGNIASGEFITRNIDIEDTANIIWNNNTITEETIPGNNLLDCGLDSPFIN